MSISYIEAHGTATAMGDPIEIEALKQVFGIEKKKYCKIGSVKKISCKIMSDSHEKYKWRKK